VPSKDAAFCEPVTDDNVVDEVDFQVSAGGRY